MILRIRDAEGNIHEIIAIKGEKGEDGKTPRCGIDYFTPTEKEEMVNQTKDAVLSALESGDGVEY